MSNDEQKVRTYIMKVLEKHGVKRDLFRSEEGVALEDQFLTLGASYVRAEPSQKERVFRVGMNNIVANLKRALPSSRGKGGMGGYKKMDNQIEATTRGFGEGNHREFRSHRRGSGRS